MIGIYSIYSKSQSKYYIGESIDINARWEKHLSDLKLGKHHSPYLQNVFNKYGIADLEFCVIEECSSEQLNDREKYYIQLYNSFKNGFNCTAGGEGCCRRVFSEETSRKLSENTRGEKNPSYGKWGDLNPNNKITKEVASYIWFYTHNTIYQFPIITRKQWVGKYGITVDIYKKIQQDKTWKNLSDEIDLEDIVMYNKTCTFIKLILSQAID